MHQWNPQRPNSHHQNASPSAQEEHCIPKLDYKLALQIALCDQKRTPKVTKKVPTRGKNGTPSAVMKTGLFVTTPVAPNVTKKGPKSDQNGSKKLPSLRLWTHHSANPCQITQPNLGPTRSTPVAPNVPKKGPKSYQSGPQALPKLRLRAKHATKTDPKVTKGYQNVHKRHTRDKQDMNRR